VIRSEFINTASVDSRGVDLSLRYPIEMNNLGSLDLFWNSAHITKYQFQESPTAPMRDGLGRRNFQTIGAPAPKVRANAGVDWLLGNHSANFTVRYTHDYSLDGNPNLLIAFLHNREPSTKVDNHTTVDMQYSYQFTEVLGMPGPAVTFGLINALDKKPPRIDDGPGYDTKIHDPRGRIAYGKIMIQF
jgi:iron complex outermembrane recepter protein